MNRLEALATLALFSALGWSCPSSVEAQPAPPMRYIPAHSSNYTAQSSRTIDRIVIHTIEGSESSGIGWMRNPVSNVSAHYVLSRAGRVTRMLRDSDKGWHCRGWNYRAIGIENEGYAHRNTWTTTQLNRLADLVAYLCRIHRVPVDRTHIVGHVEVPGNNHTDPGPYFNWNNFMSMVRARRGGSTGGGGGSTGSSTTYTVRSGDSLGAIATRFGTTVSAIAAANGISNPNLIYVGQVLRIGSGGSATPAPTPAPTPPPVAIARGVRVTASALNVRTGAWGTRLGSVSRGDRFVLTGATSGSWRQIFWRGRKAWAHGSYLTGNGGTGEQVTASALNVRSGPSTGYRRLGQVANAQRYMRVSVSGAWRKIQFDDRTGWAHGNYLRPLTVGN